MVAYKKSSPRRTNVDYSELEIREILQSKTKNWPVLIFLQVTPFLQQLTGLFYTTLSDPQDDDADCDASDTDCDIDNASKRRTKLNGWQYFMQEKLVSNFYGVSLSLKNPPFLSFFWMFKVITKVRMK